MTIFAHIVEQGSISAAADHLALSKSVLSQQLKALEQELGLTLLKRTTRKQSLTDAGMAFYQECQRLNHIVDSAWQQLEPMKQQPIGRVKITAPHALMDTLVVPAIANLIKQFPDLRPELVSEDQHLDFMQHNIDLAIRVGSSGDSNYKQKRIGVFTDILCAEAKLAKELCNNNSLLSAPYIANSWQGGNIIHEFQCNDNQMWRYQTKPSCITNSFHSCLSLLQAGAGIGLVPSFYLAKQTTGLVNLTPNMHLTENPIYALHPYNNNTPINVICCIAEIERLLSLQNGSAV